jgi:hypothetical protein
VKKVILDENLPQLLRHHLTGFDVVTVQFQGWAGIQNGELISLIDFGASLHPPSRHPTLCWEDWGGNHGCQGW